MPEQEITYFIRRNLADAVSAAKSNTPYSLSVDNTTVATSKAALGLVQGKVIGSTIVRLEDDGACGCAACCPAFANPFAWAQPQLTLSLSPQTTFLILTISRRAFSPS